MDRETSSISPHTLASSFLWPEKITRHMVTDLDERGIETDCFLSSQ